MARFKTILTDTGAILLTQALARSEKVNIDSVQMGSGIYDGDHAKIKELVSVEDLNTTMGDRQFINGEDGEPSLLKISVQTLNDGLTKAVPIREIGLFAESRLFAYAWIDGEDTDNILPPPLDINVADTIHKHELAIFVTNQENASIDVKFAFDGFVSHRYLTERLEEIDNRTKVDSHIENVLVHISEDERNALESIVGAGGVEGIKESVNNVATNLEQIGLDNTATLEQVLDRLRWEDTARWNILSILINTGMGLEPSMPLRGYGRLVIERNPNIPIDFTMKYYSNITDSDELRIFIANQSHFFMETISNERNWREIRVGESSIVKSAQRGLTNSSAAGTNVVISSVDINKSFVTINTTVGWNNNTTTAAGVARHWRAELTSGTQVRITGDGVIAPIAWQVIEFN